MKPTEEVRQGLVSAAKRRAKAQMVERNGVRFNRKELSSEGEQRSRNGLWRPPKKSGLSSKSMKA